MSGESVDPTSVGPAAADETVVVPPPTRARPQAWADWSDDEDEEPVERTDASWGAAFAASTPILFAAAVVALLIVVATAWYVWPTAPTPAPTPDETFQARMRATVPGARDFTRTDWDGASLMARQICVWIADDAYTRADVYYYLKRDDPPPPGPIADAMIDAAVDAYCPQERGKLS